MQDFDNMFLILNLAIGIYATYAAIAGKGAVYKSDLPKSIKQDADALLRKFLFVIGPLMIVFTALEYFNVFGVGAKQIVAAVGIVLVLLLIIAYVIIFRKKYGKYLKKTRF